MTDDHLYLVHIAECINRILEYTVGGREEFFNDKKTQDAAIRNLQVLAESCMRLSEATRAAHPTIDWHAIRGFRNVVVHDYLYLDLVTIWTIIEEELTPLAAAVEQSLSDLD